MFYSTDLLLRKDARFSLIWRLAVTKGHAGGTRKKQILSVNINSIVEELLQRIPQPPLTADQQANCFSLRLISQLMYGTCIVLQYQITDLHVHAKHAWESVRHIRFDEKEKSTKRKKSEKRGDGFDLDQFVTDEPTAKKRKRRSMLDNTDEQELHESQIILGMDFLDRALVNGRSAVELANITLPDDVFGGGGMNDPMFVQPEQDLIPTTDAMMDAFLNGEDTTFTTKEASENRSQQERLKDVSAYEMERPPKRPREERAASEIERHRASSHFSHISADRTGAMQTLGDEMIMQDLNLSSSMAGIDGDTRTCVPAHFVPSGPLAISTQVDPALEPILPSEASQIVPIENGDATMDASMLPPNDFLGGTMDEMRAPSVRGDEEEQQRASAGSEESRRERDMMGDLMMVEEPDVRGREKKEERMNIDGTPQVKRRKEAKEGREEDEEREDRRPVREDKPTKLDGAFMKDSMSNYADTIISTRARRVKIDDKKKKRAEELVKTIPSLMGRPLRKNRTLIDLYKSLKVDRVVLREDGESDDDLLEGLFADLPDFAPWDTIEREVRAKERREEEGEEDEKNKGRYEQRPEETMGDEQQRMHDMMMTLMDNVTMGEMEGVEHISVATIEGDWEERNEYMDVLMESRYEEKELNEDERRKVMEGRREEEGDMEEARRRRTTGNFSDGLGLNDQLDLMDQFPSYQQPLDESRRSERGEKEGEEMMDRVEWRGETEARVNRDKRSTMAQVEHHQAREIIMRKCEESETKKVTLEECIPIGANKATAARMFYNLLVLTKEQLVVPKQKVQYGPIDIGLVPTYQFPDLTI